MLDRMAVISLMLVASTLGACSSEQEAADQTRAPATSAGAATPSPSASQTLNETTFAVASAAPATPDADAAAPASAAELLRLLPDDISGQEAVKGVLTGAELVDWSGLNPSMVQFIDSLDAPAEDILFGFSFAFRADGQTGITAIRVAGVAADRLESDFRSAMEAQGGVEWQPASVGGKDVVSAADPDNEGNTQYLYTVGDVLLVVTAPDHDVAGELLEPLP